MTDGKNPSNRPWRVESKVGHAYWHKSATDTLPPPDMVGPYMRNRPVLLGAAAPVSGRKAWIIGSGIAGLAAAYYLIRDGQMPGEDITIFDEQDVAGGSLDGAGNAQDGFIVRGGREMNWNYDNFWDLFQDVPALELPAPYSVLDEYRYVNDNDPNWSKARLMHKQGQIRDFTQLGLSASQQRDVIGLLLKPKEELDDITIDEYFDVSFFETNFWYLWRSMFAFENWQSLLEMKLYMHRFMDAIDGLADMSALVFPKYNQYDSFVVPLQKLLQEKGVQFQFDTRVSDIDFTDIGGQRTATALHTHVKGSLDAQLLALGKDDVVFALTGSMTEGTLYGDLNEAPNMAHALDQPGVGSGWELWQNLAKKSHVFGHPEKFCSHPADSMWESATLTCKPSPLIDKLKTLAVNDPYSGKTVTGGIITFTDSNWVMSFTCNRQPHFPTQPEDVLVLWVYALIMDVKGNSVQKTMPECTGKEILQELCYHLGIEEQLEAVAANTKVRMAVMPFITSQFMPRAAGDRPAVVPYGNTNLALLGQFVETGNDIVFTMESSVRTARIGVYTLLNLPKQVPDISPTQYDIRNIIKGARALNNNEPFLGERLLHRLLGKTYFAHILPPVPDNEDTLRGRAESDLASLMEQGSHMLEALSAWFDSISERLKKPKD